jgi:hypothetical protein
MIDDLKDCAVTTPDVAVSAAEPIEPACKDVTQVITRRQLDLSVPSHIPVVPVVVLIAFINAWIALKNHGLLDGNLEITLRSRKELDRDAHGRR